jgi:hypothetical protein
MMPNAVGEREDTRPLHLTLNSDGRRHPVLNVLTVFTFCAGVVAFAFGIMVRFHFEAAVLGIVAFGLGLIAQMMSATREQRVLIVAGLIAAFVGLGLGIAHGGFG